MDKYSTQASHNQEFHDHITSQFPDRFHDWEITALFYVAIHCLKALAASRKIDIGATHFDIEKNVNPERDYAKMRISMGAWKDYKSLFKYLQSSRYDGLIDTQTFEKLKSLDHLECLGHLRRFNQYVKAQGATI